MVYTTGSELQNVDPILDEIKSKVRSKESEILYGFASRFFLGISKEDLNTKTK